MSVETLPRSVSADTARRHWSLPRVAAGIVLATWAAMFWFVWLGGRSYYYLSSRTAWVIPAGAILLTVAAIGRLASARTPVGESLSRRELIILTIFLFPALLVMILPPQSLSAYAVGRRPSFISGVSASAEDISTGSLTMLEVAGAQATRKGLDALAARAGDTVSYVGFVTRSDSTPANEFFLNRFVITCCTADAQGAYIRVVDAPPGQFQQNDWVKVTGTIYPLGRDVIIQADAVVPTAKPNPPYLTP